MLEYPLPGHHFKVEWGGTRLGFSEVSGLDLEGAHEGLTIESEG